MRNFTAQVFFFMYRINAEIQFIFKLKGTTLGSQLKLKKKEAKFVS